MGERNAEIGVFLETLAKTVFCNFILKIRINRHIRFLPLTFTHIFPFTISRFSGKLDAELETWRSRPFGQDFPYVLLDARWEKCRRDGAIVDSAFLVAIGVAADGHRHVLVVETGWGESEPVWTEFIGRLKDRGLSGVQLFTSDAYPGIRAAVRAHYAGIPWQRCQYHFLANALDKVPQKREDQIERPCRGYGAKKTPPSKPGAYLRS